jgi:hypothetical protein
MEEKLAKLSIAVKKLIKPANQFISKIMVFVVLTCSISNLKLKFIGMMSKLSKTIQVTVPKARR